MKKFLPFIFLILAQGICIAQSGEWVWIHGPDTANAPGVFGVQGISSPLNNPPGLYEPCEWTDLNGNFWLYGGLNPFIQRYGDLWKYDPLINEWTWMKGSGLGNVPPNYGTIGVPSPANDPGSRSFGAATWVDAQGNFWMFGGTDYLGNSCADLWKYEPATNIWTWMKGPQGVVNVGVYGTQGIPDTANFPGSRHEVTASWTDNAGDLWLFGGLNLNLGFKNDLWRYHISSNEWTWMKGSQGPAPNVYGLQGIEDPANTPGSRAAFAHWKDLQGNLWMFGGEKSQNNNYNDLWRFNPGTNNWAWFKGGSTSGIYGSQCISNSTNIPGARFENRACVTDVDGNFWFFGGHSDLSHNAFNDLWKYCVSSNEWIWIAGDDSINSSGNWGVIGVSSPLNHPNARGGNVMWADSAGHLYLYGGMNIDWPGVYTDLWMYTIDSTCAICPPQIDAMFNAPNQICPGTCINFTNTSLGGNSFQWSFPGGNPATSVDSNPANICYANPGSYDVTLIAFNGAGSDTTTISNYITVFPTPPPQAILQSGDTLFANQGAMSYQWFENGNLIPGATNYFYVALESGNYNVVATDENDCEVEAVIFDVIAEVDGSLLTKSEGFAIFPNPANDILEIRNLKAGENISIVIYNNLGEKIFDQRKEHVNENLFIDINEIPPGTYHLEISNENTSARKIFIKQ